MLPKSFVLALGPSSTSEKSLNGAGDAVNPNDVVVSGVACFTTVSDPGKTTASADRERSWLPPEPSSPMSRVWYGEPGMATAEVLAPQSARLEMCPPQASTGFGLPEATVKVSVMRADLSPLKPAPSA